MLDVIFLHAALIRVIFLFQCNTCYVFVNRFLVIKMLSTGITLFDYQGIHVERTLVHTACTPLPFTR